MNVNLLFLVFKFVFIIFVSSTWRNRQTSFFLIMFCQSEYITLGKQFDFHKLIPIKGIRFHFPKKIKLVLI